MELGAVFPQTEIGNDPIVIRDFAQTVEELGYSHLLVYDHVLGADRDRPGGFQGPYDKDTAFHEPFVLFGYLAGLTSKIELVSTVLVLPQRQTSLVAKQAAEADVLSGGRVRLGVGSGWNHIEYEALGVDMANRGARQEEQVQLMRELWAKDSVDFTGRFHRVNLAGINPRPSRQIPVWFGGSADPLLKRAARIGDGWMPLGAPKQEAPALEKLRGFLEETGRSGSFGIQAQAQAAGGTPERWVKHALTWKEMGATHLALATMNAGFMTLDDHLGALRQYMEVVREHR